MWPDPNFPKRKPHSLGGTPANKFSVILGVSIVVIYAVGLNLLSYTPYLTKKIENLKKSVIKSQEDRKDKAFLSDPLVQGAINRKKKEYEEESDSNHLF